jgi:hypothetical protein
MWMLLWTASGRPGFGGSASLGGSVGVKSRRNLTLQFQIRALENKLAG